MRRKINITPNEYTPIRSLLHYAVTEYETYQDQYIKVMVRDALLLAENKDYRLRADRRMIRYSLYLSQYKRDTIATMNPNALGRNEYNTLLEIFQNL